MSQNKYTPCYQCRCPQSKEWEDVKTLKFALDTDRLCDLHKAAAEEKIKNHKEVKIYELKTPSSFLPPPRIRNPRNWQDREFNNGELIE